MGARRVESQPSDGEGGKLEVLANGTLPPLPGGPWAPTPGANPMPKLSAAVAVCGGNTTAVAFPTIVVDEECARLDEN